MGNTCSTDLIDFDSDPGYALILGYDKYSDGTEQRKGNAEDVKKLKSVLASRGFTFSDASNLTVEDTKQKINDLANKEEYLPYSSLTVIVMTHGTYDGLLRAEDGYFRTEHIWKPLINCPNFKNKPKLLIFQACRGIMGERLVVQDGRPVQEKNEQSSPQFEFGLPKLPHDSNFFIAFSAVPNTLSIRNESNGSWFIQTLCAELGSIKSAIKLEVLFTRVTYMLVNNSRIGYAQTPSFVSFLPQQLNVKAAEEANYLTNQFSNFANLATDNATCSSNIALQSPDIAVDTSDLVFDASGNRNTVVNIPNYYTWEHRMNGRAVIYYTKIYVNDANKLYTTLKRLNFNVSAPILVEGDNFLNSLQDVSTDSDLQLENCILVAILAPISSNSPTSQEFFIAERLISKTWTPFIASKCSYLHMKPKIFLYLDNLDTYDYCHSPSIYEMDLAYDNAANQQNVTDHVDFLHVFGYGRAYFDALLSHFETGFQSQNDIFEILTSAQNSALWNYGQGSKIDTLPYYTSTLSLMMRLNNTTYQVTTEPKSLSRPVSETNQDIVIDSGTAANNEIQCVNKIDREVQRVIVDGAEFVEQASEVLPVILPQLKAILQVFRKNK